MTVTMARDSWTDDRLDDLNHRVDEGFTETRTEFRSLRSEMQEEFRAVRSEMQEEFRAVRSEMAAMHRTLVQAIVGGLAVTLVGFAGTIATILAT
ncbi:MAG TPA: hypothetical protein VHI77_08450 [Solirubrobacterales bacterium]|jgi:hypothetical protein|nr:hypothetical protein [Solirubrobacterales bacterium]